MTDSGLQYKDLRDGSGDAVSNGSHVTVDWDGYTLGYYGRPFEARNKVNVQLWFMQRQAALFVITTPNIASPLSDEVELLLSKMYCCHAVGLQYKCLSPSWHLCREQPTYACCMISDLLGHKMLDCSPKVELLSETQRTF